MDAIGPVTAQSIELQGFGGTCQPYDVRVREQDELDAQ